MIISVSFVCKEWMNDARSPQASSSEHPDRSEYSEMLCERSDAKEPEEEDEQPDDKDDVEPLSIDDQNTWSNEVIPLAVCC